MKETVGIATCLIRMIFCCYLLFFCCHVFTYTHSCTHFIYFFQTLLARVYSLNSWYWMVLTSWIVCI